MDATHRQITKIARNAARFASGALQSGGIGSSEYECLHALRKNEGASQEQLAQLLGVDKAAVTRMVQNLEKKGYLTREKDKHDRRKNKLYSTGKALAIKDDKASGEAMFYAWLLEDLSEAQARAFVETLDILYQKSKVSQKDGFEAVKAWCAGKEQHIK